MFELSNWTSRDYAVEIYLARLTATSYVWICWVPFYAQCWLRMRSKNHTLTLFTEVPNCDRAILTSTGKVLTVVGKSQRIKRHRSVIRRQGTQDSAWLRMREVYPAIISAGAKNAVVMVPCYRVNLSGVRLKLVTRFRVFGWMCKDHITARNKCAAFHFNFEYVFYDQRKLYSSIYAIIIWK